MLVETFLSEVWFPKLYKYKILTVLSCSRRRGNIWSSIGMYKPVHPTQAYNQTTIKYIYVYEKKYSLNSRKRLLSLSIPLKMKWTSVYPLTLQVSWANRHKWENTERSEKQKNELSLRNTN